MGNARTTIWMVTDREINSPDVTWVARDLPDIIQMLGWARRVIQIRLDDMRARKMESWLDAGLSKVVVFIDASMFDVQDHVELVRPIMAGRCVGVFLEVSFGIC